MKHSNLALVEGEVYILSNQKIKESDFVYNNYVGEVQKVKSGWDCNNNDQDKKIIASTADLDGIPKLERKWFVKPVDVEELAEESADKKYHPNSEIKPHFKNGFKAGYNANKAEFTRDEMKTAYIAGMAHAASQDIERDFNKFIGRFYQISLPKSITLNDDNEIISVEW